MEGPLDRMLRWGSSLRVLSSLQHVMQWSMRREEDGVVRGEHGVVRGGHGVVREEHDVGLERGVGRENGVGREENADGRGVNGMRRGTNDLGCGEAPNCLDDQRERTRPGR